jgi:Fic family protein
MILDATQNFDQKLTKERLFKWHALLFPSGLSGFSNIKVGNWRKGPVDVVSGRAGKEVIHFEAPPASRLNNEMKTFLQWLNDDSSEQDLLIKTAIAHLWFVTIHPFDDGNGRIGRAIADLMLALTEGSSRRFYSLSAQIQKERNDYYAILENTQKGNLDITQWLKWFLGCLERSIDEALRGLNIILHKTRFWESRANTPFNERQRKVIHLLLGDFEGNLTTSKWAKIAKCSQDTAYRDILDLIEKDVLMKNPGSGRSTHYSLRL